jgi:threonine aldolase
MMSSTALDRLPKPSVSFASDNSSGALPEVLDALARANRGHVKAYGNDDITADAVRRFRDLFGANVEVLFVWGGTGANVVGLSTMLSASDAVICASGAHINVDEGGAAERFLGTKLISVATADGKLRPDDVLAHAWMLGDEHHVQPKVLSITQSTELGTLYTPNDVVALADVARTHSMFVHMDGARIANAAAALGDVRSFTIDAGVDALSFGGTKNGMMYGEAVVLINPALAARAKFLRKQAMQLPSKTRFIAVQFATMLTDDLWLRTAAHSNAMTRRLHDATSDILGVRFDRAPEVNALFPILPTGVIESLSNWCPFYPWDLSRSQARWMTTWDTAPTDVDRFAAGVRAAVS